MDFKSEEDIITFALIREHNAYSFYMDLADRVRTSERRELFERFAQEELKHKARLELELMKRGQVVDEAEQDIDLEESAYKSEATGELHQDYENLLFMAIEKEKKSFEFYVDLYGRTKKKELRKIILELAAEEARHWIEFQMEYDKVTSTPH